MISFSCQGCGHKYKVKDDLAGKRVRCKKCNHIMCIPDSGTKADNSNIGSNKKSSGTSQTRLPSEQITIECAMCHHSFLYPERKRGKYVSCPKCYWDTLVPELTTINFKCPSCGNPMEAPESLRDKTILCQVCGVEVAVSEKNSSVSKEETVSPIKLQKRTKDCPYCGEEILAVAKKCKHCGEFMDNHFPVSSMAKTKSNNNDIIKTQTDIFALLCFATGMLGFFILPIIFTPICYISAIISYYRLKDNPELKGKWLRITGAMLGIISMLYLFYQLGYFDESLRKFQSAGDDTNEYTETYHYEFPAQKIREGIKNSTYHTSDFTIKDITVSNGDNLEYSYDIRITVSSMLRAISDSIPDQGIYVFHVDRDLRLSDSYTVIGGERESEINDIYKMVNDSLMKAR